MIYFLQTKIVPQTNYLTESAASYLPIALQIIFVILLVGAIILFTHVFGPKRGTSKKLENFSSGIISHGTARQPIAIKYFLAAILFVLIDVEIIFFYPYAINFKELGWDSFIAVLIFTGIFLCGFIYILMKGALNWKDSQNKS